MHILLLVCDLILEMFANVSYFSKADFRVNDR